MPKSTQFVGIDLHQDTVTFAVLPDGASTCDDPVTMDNDPSKIRRFLERVAKRGPLACCYEASGCGYVLQRRLASWGIACEIIAPSLIPRASGDRRKTDKRDAANLARAYRKGDLVPIRIPTEAEERVRALVRCRETLTREILASRHYVLKFLQVRGLRWDKASKWTGPYWEWLRAQSFEREDRATFDTYLALLNAKLELRKDIDAQIEAIAIAPAYVHVVGRLRCLKGVDTLTAMVLATEVGDVRRFSTPRKLMDYFGLTVSEFSSGGKERRGGITKAGNGRCRRVLVEAAWNYRHAPRESKALRGRREGQPGVVIEHARRAEHRLKKRFDALEKRMRSTKAAVAVARELTGFVWALMQPHDAGIKPSRN